MTGPARPTVPAWRASGNMCYGAHDGATAAEYVALMFAPRFDYAARSTWTNLSDTELASTWTKYVATRMLGDNCPKVGIDFFIRQAVEKLRCAAASYHLAFWREAVRDAGAEHALRILRR